MHTGAEQISSVTKLIMQTNSFKKKLNPKHLSGVIMGLSTGTVQIRISLVRSTFVVAIFRNKYVFHDCVSYKNSPAYKST